MTQFRQLEFELVSSVLSIFERLFQTLRSVVALDLLLKLANPTFVFRRLRSQLMYCPVQQMNLAFLDDGQDIVLK